MAWLLSCDLSSLTPSHPHTLTPSQMMGGGGGGAAVEDSLGGGGYNDQQDDDDWDQQQDGGSHHPHYPHTCTHTPSPPSPPSHLYTHALPTLPTLTLVHTHPHRPHHRPQATTMRRGRVGREGSGHACREASLRSRATSLAAQALCAKTSTGWHGNSIRHTKICIHVPRL